MQVVCYCFEIFAKFGVSRQIFVKAPQYKISRKSVHSEPRRQKDGRTNITKLAGAFHYVCERDWKRKISAGNV